MKKSLGAKTILYPTPVMVVGSYDAAGKATDLGRLRPILYAPEHPAYHAVGAFVGKAFSMGKILKEQA